MPHIQRITKATTRKGKKILLSKEPQVIEEPKRTLLLQGRKTSETVRRLIKDIYDLKKPDSLLLSKKHDVTIFEDPTPVEIFCKKYESPLFVMGSHSKKRPNNLVLGRIFNYSLLDMIELGVDSFQDMKSFSCPKINIGTKPCLIFNGTKWDETPEYKHLKSLFVDLFHREPVSAIRLQGLEHAMSFTITEEGKVLLRSYKVALKKSGCQTPRIELEEMGPRIDFTLRRSKLPDADLLKEACSKPRILKIVKKKNISRDGLGTVHANVHVGKQPLQRLQTRKMKGLKKTSQEKTVHNKKRAFQENIDNNSNKRTKVD